MLGFATRVSIPVMVAEAQGLQRFALRKKSCSETREGLASGPHTLLRYFGSRAVSSAVRASRLHREGPRFKSVTAHHKLLPVFAGDVVQLVRTLPCHGRGRGFESRRPRHIFKHLQRTRKKIWVRLGPITRRCTPSTAHSFERKVECAPQHQLLNQS